MLSLAAVHAAVHALGQNPPSSTVIARVQRKAQQASAAAGASDAAATLGPLRLLRLLGLLGLLRLLRLLRLPVLPVLPVLLGLLELPALELRERALFPPPVGNPCSPKPGPGKREPARPPRRVQFALARARRRGRLADARRVALARHKSRCKTRLGKQVQRSSELRYLLVGSVSACGTTAGVKRAGRLQSKRSFAGALVCV
jgi:hypothetical protein